MKYHYSDRFFTYSVRRSGSLPARECLLILALSSGGGSSVGRAAKVPVAAAPSPCPAALGRFRCVGGGGRCSVLPPPLQPAEVCLPFAPHRRGPLRSAPRTESGGEFDWGGTSVK